MYLLKKSVSRTRTRDLLHTVRIILSCTTGVHTLTLECWPILFWVYIEICIICAPGAWCRIDSASSSMLGTQHVAVQRPTLYTAQRLSRMDTCCWRDLSVSSLCWNSVVLQPTLCVAYVRCELCKQCAQQLCMISKLSKTKLAYVVEWDEKAWGLGRSEFDTSLGRPRIEISES